MNLSTTLLKNFGKIDDIPLFFRLMDVGLSLSEKDIEDFQSYWDDLPVDKHAEQVAHVRRRRHATFLYDYEQDTLVRQAQSTYFQEKDYNRIYGGAVRSFAPIEPWFLERFCFVEKLLQQCAKNVSIVSKGALIHCHLMRIPLDAKGCGYPSPEGIHHDGFDYVSLHLIRKENCVGGQSIVTDGASEIVSAPYLDKFLDSLVINDKKFAHAALPFFGIDAGVGYRDTMLASYQRI